MEKKDYVIPESSYFEVYLEFSLLTSVNSTGEKASMSSITGDFDDLFD